MFRLINQFIFCKAAVRKIINKNQVLFLCFKSIFDTNYKRESGYLI